MLKTASQITTPSIIPNVLSIQIFPNPLTHRAVIEYELPHAGYSHLRIVDVQGGLVRNLLEGIYQAAGKHQLQMPVADLAKGMYFVSLKTNKQVITEKIIVIDD